MMIIIIVVVVVILQLRHMYDKYFEGSTFNSNDNLETAC